ncbi:MAG: tetratricopeptide repeat protein [Bacteriovoracia bacterium]
MDKLKNIFSEQFLSFLQSTNFKAIFLIFSITLSVIGAFTFAFYTYVKSVRHFDKDYYTKGVELVATKNYSEALVAFENQILRSPSDPSGYYGIGWVHQLQGEKESAIERYNKAILLSKRILEYSSLNLCLLQNDHSKDALEKCRNKRN